MEHKLSEEDKIKAGEMIKQAGISFAGIIVEWTDKEGVKRFGVVPSNLEKSVTDFVFISKIKKKGKTIVYSRSEGRVMKFIVKLEKLKVIGFNN